MIVLAVLTVGSRYALQHRDDLPTVAAPGCWALFGGSVDEGEVPEAAIRREVREELALDVVDWRLLWRVRYYVAFWDAEVHHFIFAADITEMWPQHVLHEGQATDVFAIDALPTPMDPAVIAMLERHHDEAHRRARC